MLHGPINLEQGDVAGQDKCAPVEALGVSLPHNCSVYRFAHKFQGVVSDSIAIIVELLMPDGI